MAGWHSPDSSISISSLLASCSLASSKRSCGGSIEYKDTLYDSASKALEAYIEDFEDSLRSPMASMGKISIHPTLGSAKKKVDTNVRSKHFRRSRSTSRDADLLSLTTDDLLAFPSDGTLPFSQLSHWKRSKSLNNHHEGPGWQSSRNTRAHLGSSHHTSLDLPRLGGDHKEKRRNILHDGGKHADYYKLKASAEHKRYPLWLTSHKCELAVSGISSIPDLGYPLWIKDYGLLGDLGTPAPISRHDSLRAAPTHQPFRGAHGSPSLVSSHARYGGRSKEAVNGTLYSGLSDLDAIKDLRTPPKNHTGDSPLRHSEDVTAFPQHRDNDGSPRTEDVLEAERSWEKTPYSLKSPIPIACTEEVTEDFAAPSSHVGEAFHKDKVKDESKASSFSGGNHHGPVEALKHMLFNLQAFQQNFPQAQSMQKEQPEASCDLQRVDQEDFPVNRSLQKAMQHLARLKELVGDGTTKQEQENDKEVEV